jgi:hypothetical protein
VIKLTEPFPDLPIVLWTDCGRDLPDDAGDAVTCLKRKAAAGRSAPDADPSA